MNKECTKWNGLIENFNSYLNKDIELKLYHKIPISLDEMLNMKIDLKVNDLISMLDNIEFELK